MKSNKYTRWLDANLFRTKSHRRWDLSMTILWIHLFLSLLTIGLVVNLFLNWRNELFIWKYNHQIRKTWYTINLMAISVYWIWHPVILLLFLRNLWIIGIMVVFVDAFVLVGASFKKFESTERGNIVKTMNEQKNWYMEERQKLYIFLRVLQKQVIGSEWSLDRLEELLETIAGFEGIEVRILPFDSEEDKEQVTSSRKIQKILTNGESAYDEKHHTAFFPVTLAGSPAVIQLSSAHTPITEIDGVIVLLMAVIYDMVTTEKQDIEQGIGISELGNANIRRSERIELPVLDDSPQTKRMEIEVERMARK